MTALAKHKRDWSHVKNNNKNKSQSELSQEWWHTLVISTPYMRQECGSKLKACPGYTIPLGIIPPPKIKLQNPSTPLRQRNKTKELQH